MSLLLFISDIRNLEGLYFYLLDKVAILLDTKVLNLNILVEYRLVN